MYSLLYACFLLVLCFGVSVYTGCLLPQKEAGGEFKLVHRKLKSVGNARYVCILFCSSSHGMIPCLYVGLYTLVGGYTLQLY